MFDLDDTIFDHHQTSRRALAAVRDAEPAFQIWSLDEFGRRHKQVLEALHRGGVMQGFVSVDDARDERFRRLLAEAGTDAGGRAEAAAALYRQTYVAERCLVPGAEALLRALRIRVPLAIVTNNILAEQEAKLQRFGLRSLIDALVVSAEEGVSKPDPEIFHRALARLGVTAGHAVMVGDTWSADIEGAKAAGLRAVWFNRWGVPAPDDPLVLELRSLEPASETSHAILSAGT